MACEIKDPTGNPLCSDSLKDLKDNAVIMDQYINSEEFEVPDRLGIPRKTWAGLEEDVRIALANLDPKVEQLIAEKIIAQGGVEIVNEWGESLEKVINQDFLTKVIKNETVLIYVSNSGGGDGSIQSQPTTIHMAFDKVNDKDNNINSSFEIILIEDIATTGISIPNLRKINGVITVRALNDVNVKWEKSTTSQSKYAFRVDTFFTYENYFHFQNIDFEGWDDETSNSGAIVLWGRKNVILEDCNIKNCGIGVWVSRLSELRILGGNISNNRTAIMCQYHSSLSIGREGRVVNIENNNLGVYSGRNNTTHIDYAYFSGNNINVYGTQNGRIAHRDGVIYNNWVRACFHNQSGNLIENTGLPTYNQKPSISSPIILNDFSSISDIASSSMLKVRNTYRALGSQEIAPDGVRTLYVQSYISLDVPNVILQEGMSFEINLYTSGQNPAVKLELASSSPSLTAVLTTFDIPKSYGVISIKFIKRSVGCIVTCNLSGNDNLYQIRNVSDSVLESFLGFLNNGRLTGRLYITNSDTDKRLDVMYMESFVTI